VGYAATRSRGRATPGGCAPLRPEAKIRIGPVHDACRRRPVHGVAFSAEYPQNLPVARRGRSVGALTCAFLDRWSATNCLHFQNVEVEAHEIDAPLRAH